MEQRDDLRGAVRVVANADFERWADDTVACLAFPDQAALFESRLWVDFAGDLECARQDVLTLEHGIGAVGPRALMAQDDTDVVVLRAAARAAFELVFFLLLWQEKGSSAKLRATAP